MPLARLLLLYLLAITSTAGAAEVDALLTFKRVLRIPPKAASFFATWHDAATSPCNFIGVTCNHHGRVTSVSVQGQSIVVDFVPFKDICGALPALVTLSLSNNKLNGGIDGVVACTGLHELTLAINGFSSPVSDLSPLKRLQILNISRTNLVGSFSWISLLSMPNLTMLALGKETQWYYNVLFEPTSEFPDEVTKLTNLTALYMLGANIGGTIPPEIGELTNLTELDLSFNSLSSKIAMETAKLSNLQHLDISLTNLRSFPWTSLLSMSNLSVLALGDLPHHVFFEPTSSFPDEVTKLRNLTVLCISAANIDGAIPPWIDDLINLVDLDLSFNNLSGEIPKEIAKLTNIQYLDLSNNSLHGELPSGFGNLTKL